MYLNAQLTNYFFAVVIIFKVVTVCGKKCVYRKESGDYDYKHCDDDCCGDTYNIYCCNHDDDDNDNDGSSTTFTIGITIATIIGFLIAMVLLLLCVKYCCVSSSRTQQNTSARRTTHRQIVTCNTRTEERMDMQSQNAGPARGYEIYFIPQEENWKPPPYTAFEPTAPPPYDEVMRQDQEKNRNNS